MKSANFFFRRSSILVGLFVIFAINPGLRADVELPDDELAKESVTAKFDQYTTYKNRLIPLDGKFEIGIYYGVNFNEAIENQSRYGLNLGYHWSEIHTISLNVSVAASGLNSQYAGPLYSTYGLNFNRAPTQQSSIWLTYEPNLFYGKVSVTKETVAHFDLFPILGVGQNSWSNKSFIGPEVGVGWRVYFSDSIALRADMNFQYISKPSPFLGGYMKDSQPKPSDSQFSTETMFNTVFDLGLVAVF